jgi:serine/threonine protein kinase
MLSKKGGALLSSGSYGCVYSPPLPCDMEPAKKPQSTDISKVFATQEEAESEWQKSTLLKSIDPKQTYLLYPRIQCTTSAQAIQANDIAGKECPLFKNQTDPQARFSQLISSNGGKPLYDYMADMYQTGNPITMIDYLKLLLQIGKGIQLLNSKGYCHHDIKPNNILVDTNGIPRIIDFGFLMEYKIIPSDKNRFLEKNYWIHPPEYWVMNKKIKGDSIKPLEKYQYIMNRLNQYNSVFSEKDKSEIIQWYIYFWPSQCDIEQAYLKAMTGDTLGMMSSSDYPYYVDVYSMGIMMMYMVQFVDEFNDTNFMETDAFKTYKTIVRGAMHPDLQKRYSISKVLKLVRTLVR